MADSTIKSILFVDDEPRLLSGLERALRPKRDVWDMRFAGSGEAALLHLGQRVADIVVTDFRMPGMNGAALLDKVRQRYPETVRFMLSGQFDTQAGMRAVPVAHQFLAKPCEPGVLIGRLEQACRLLNLISNDVIRRISSALGTLPPNPDVYMRLSRAFDDERVSLQTITSIIEEDVSLTVKVLQLANSAYFGAAQNVDTISGAIRSLGFDVLRQMVLVAEIFQRPEAGRMAAGFSRQQLHDHSMWSARVAQRVLAPRPMVFSASVASLMHDVGQLVLATELPDEYEQVLAARNTSGCSLSEAERTILMTTHAEVGAYVAGLWGFADNEVKAILHHHDPVHLPSQPPAAIDAEGRVHDLNLLVALADHLSGEPRNDLGAHPHLANWTTRAEALKNVESHG